MHVSTSQLHECGKCCLRYKKKHKKTAEKSSTESPTLFTKISDIIKNTKDKLLNYIQICRFRSPWSERMCKVCNKENKNLRFDICQDCLNKDDVQTDTNAQHYPYRPQPKTKITYSIRFNRESRFYSTRPEINVCRNNPWVTTHNRDAMLINAGNTDLQITFHIDRIIS